MSRPYRLDCARLKSSRSGKPESVDTSDNDAVDFFMVVVVVDDIVVVVDYVLPLLLNVRC